MAAAETLALRARSVARSGINPGAAALALSIPFLFLHIKYQPGVRVPLGSTHLGLELSDLAVVVVALLAVREGLRTGFTPLRPALPLWVGTLSDVEDILPATPGMFDLVVIDESHNFRNNTPGRRDEDDITEMRTLEKERDAMAARDSRRATVAGAMSAMVAANAWTSRRVVSRSGLPTVRMNAWTSPP